VIEPQALIELSDALVVGAILSAHAKKSGSASLIGVAGSQGSGKSTTARRIGARLQAAGLRVVIRSLDDFYLTRRERQDLAKRVHPLLATRGVPGTHDLDLLHRTIEALQISTAASRTALPSFDKMADDRRPESQWPRHEGQTDLIILEGWCMGARPQAESALIEPINDLEREEDADGTWRRYANRELATRYAALFSLFDLTILFKAPDFSVVHKWRDEQEEKLARSEGRARSMDAKAIERFISHYERLTRWIMYDEPADLIVEINAARTPIAWRVSPALVSGR
jgi:D-glycerate 3-kinase